VVEYRILPSYLNAAAEVLEVHFEEITAGYEERLIAIGSPLVAEAKTREQVMAQARSVLKEVTADLRGREAPSAIQQSAAHLSEIIGVSGASCMVHVFHFLRAAVAFSEAVLSVVTDNLPPSPTSRSETAAVALTIQKIFMERVMRADRKSVV
jgi:hypothetical protein